MRGRPDVKTSITLVNAWIKWCVKFENTQIHMWKEILFEKLNNAVPVRSNKIKQVTFKGSKTASSTWLIVSRLKAPVPTSEGNRELILIIWESYLQITHLHFGIFFSFFWVG